MTNEIIVLSALSAFSFIVLVLATRLQSRTEKLLEEIDEKIKILKELED